MSDGFKENFNYLVAFLAVLFGLSAFKDAAEANHVLLFGLSLNYLALAAPFVFLMLLASYTGALTMLSKNLNFSAFPLTKVLESISYWLASLGLLYPIVLVFILLISWLAPYISSIDYPHLDSIATSLAALASAYSAFLLTRTRLQNRYEVKLSELRKIAYVEKTPLNTEVTDPYEIIMLYHQLTTLGNAILRLKGFGISGEDTRTFGRLLHKQGFLSKSDLKTLDQLRRFRNEIAHSSSTPSQKSLQNAQKQLVDLIDKMKKEIFELERVN